MRTIRIIAPLILAATSSCTTWQNVPRETALYVNNDTPHYAVEKSQEEGESDLCKLASTADSEEGFVYDKAAGIWYEVGNYHEQNVTRLSHWELAQLGGTGSKRKFYHIHYARLQEIDQFCLHVKKRLEAAIANNDEQEQEYLKQYLTAATLAFAFPSAPDVKVYYSRYTPCLEDAIGSENGIMDFTACNALGRKWIEAYSDVKDYSPRDSIEYTMEKLRQNASPEEALEYAAAKMNERWTGKLQFEFRAKR
ncbi:hypothetical protein HY642_00485 [Candidatus Woesearchaeota archaeon]|nr:hypothetical protein [Candidatus Woesearchaeota archaeon]